MMNGTVRIYIGCATAVGIVLCNEYSGQTWHVLPPTTTRTSSLPSDSDWLAISTENCPLEQVSPLVEARAHTCSQDLHKTPHSPCRLLSGNFIFPWITLQTTKFLSCRQVVQKGLSLSLRKKITSGAFRDILHWSSPNLLPKASCVKYSSDQTPV